MSMTLPRSRPSAKIFLRYIFARLPGAQNRMRLSKYYSPRFAHIIYRWHLCCAIYLVLTLLDFACSEIGVQGA